MPSILFINRVYPPADGATGRMLEHVAKGFISSGWEVTVLTTDSPGEPSGTSYHGGVRIVRCGTFFSKKNLIARLLSYALMIPSLGLRALLLTRADVVVTKTDPPLLLILGPVLKVLKGSRLIHWAQDLYPEIAEQAGLFTPGSAVAKLLRRISAYAMCRYDRTVAVGRCMAERIAAKGVSFDKIRVIPNIGMEAGIIPVDLSINGFRLRHGLKNSFVVEYSGNIGRVHEFDTLLEVAKRMQARGERDIVFLMIGSGPGESLLKKKAEQMGLENMRFFPSFPVGELSESLGAGDLHLVTMKEEMSGLVVPSKFYGVLAAERPCLFIGPAKSEIARIVLEHDAGTVIRPGDADALFTSILSYRDDPGKGIAQGKEGRSILTREGAVQLFVQTAYDVLSS